MSLFKQCCQICLQFLTPLWILACSHICNHLLAGCKSMWVHSPPVAHLRLLKCFMVVLAILVPFLHPATCSCSNQLPVMVFKRLSCNHWHATSAHDLLVRSFWLFRWEVLRAFILIDQSFKVFFPLLDPPVILIYKLRLRCLLRSLQTYVKKVPSPKEHWNPKQCSSWEPKDFNHVLAWLGWQILLLFEIKTSIKKYARGKLME